jgi:REP-associated tyrosine transposase
MARIARIVIPNCPHHVTQRGVRRLQTFFCDDDYLRYIDLMRESCRAAGTAVWAYCLMPNHVHLVMVPSDKDGLRRAISITHWRYTRYINARHNWRGHLWQERFYSSAMDEVHLHRTVRYVEQNPVTASLCDSPEDWQWSSARAHLSATDDSLVTVAPMLERIRDYGEYIRRPLSDKSSSELELHLRTGRPLGNSAFVDKIEALLKRSVRPKAAGCKARNR